MPEEFNQLNEEERLKAENDFLKMKLMLENGAQFEMSDTNELPAAIENEFLQNMAAFEKQFDEHKTIKVFYKIGRPAHFKPVAEIPDEEIGKAWEDLSDHLGEYGISLDVCSPNISKRELYRFTIEELFEYEMDDISVPGMMHGFIYDEFHPDPVYDNTRAATEDCINYILEKEPMEWTHHFRKEGLRLNDHFPLSIDEFRDTVNRFKMAYDDLEIKELSGINCSVNDKLSTVTGTYSVLASVDSTKHTLSGDWKVVFELEEEFGYWYITEVEISGIKF